MISFVCFPLSCIIRFKKYSVRIKKKLNDRRQELHLHPLAFQVGKLFSGPEGPTDDPEGSDERSIIELPRSKWILR